MRSTHRAIWLLVPDPVSKLTGFLLSTLGIVIEPCGTEAVSGLMMEIDEIRQRGLRHILRMLNENLTLNDAIVRSIHGCKVFTGGTIADAIGEFFCDCFLGCRFFFLRDT